MENKLEKVTLGMENDLIVFADSFMPNDQIVNSTLGVRNGDVYSAIINKIRSDPKNLATKLNWDQIVKIRKI